MVDFHRCACSEAVVSVGDAIFATDRFFDGRADAFVVAGAVIFAVITDIFTTVTRGAAFGVALALGVVVIVAASVFAGVERVRRRHTFAELALLAYVAGAAGATTPIGTAFGIATCWNTSGGFALKGRRTRLAVFAGST